MRYEFIDRRSPYVICVFNSRVDKRFEWFKTLEERDVSALHIVDEAFSWYHDCLDDVRELVYRYAPARLVGSSMGGYAALLIGSLHRIQVRAFGPQTTIKCEWDMRWTPEWEAIQAKTKYPQYLDLWGLKAAGDIYYCKGVAEDVIHAQRMRGCTLKPRGCDKHSDEVNNLVLSDIFDI